MFLIPVNNIPERTNTSKGINIKTLISLDANEIIQTATSTTSKIANYVVFFTKKGFIKKTNIEEYSSLKKTTGIQAIKLKDDDEIIHVAFMEDENVILMTHDGIIIKVPTDDIKAIGRLTYGVKGISLKENDYVIAACPINKDDAGITFVTINGKGKRVKIENIIIQNRGGRGVSYMKLDSGDYIAAATTFKEDSIILIAGKPNSICIPALEISEQTKVGSGTKVIERSIVQTIVRL